MRGATSASSAVLLAILVGVDRLANPIGQRLEEAVEVAGLSDQLVGKGIYGNEEDGGNSLVSLIKINNCRSVIITLAMKCGVACMSDDGKGFEGRG